MEKLNTQDKKWGEKAVEPEKPSAHLKPYNMT